MSRVGPLLLAACACGLLLAPSAGAATFTVGSTADLAAHGPTNDGVCDAQPGPEVVCTLRAAVQEANDFNGTDLIVVPNLGAPYLLGGPPDDDLALSGDLDLRASVTLRGTGRPVIDAGRGDRVLHLTSPGSPSVAASGLVLRGGADVIRGGGVLVDAGTLSLKQATIASNFADGPGLRQGGGIWIGQGTGHRITASTLNGNRAAGVTGADGGGLGVAAGAAVTLANSTISDNTAEASAGEARGGGIWAAGGPVTLTHVTMSRNEAGGVGGAEGGLVHVQGGSVRFRATILDRGDADPGSQNCRASGGGILTSLGSNLESLGLGGGSQCGLKSSAADRFTLDGGVTGLGNRGGATQTHALFNHSSALDAIPSCFPVTADQRGQPRPGAFACDIGSYERQVAVTGIRCFGRDPTIVGFGGSERIIGTPGDDVIAASGGNDLIKGRGGNDRICAGKGKDRVFGGPGNDRIAGEDGRDKLYGQGGKDRLLGGSGRDLLVGGKGRDRLDGGPGRRDNCRGSKRDRLRRC